MTADHPRVRVEALTSFCVRAMRAAGLSEEQARTSAEVLVTTDTWGTHTHGTKQLRGLLKNFRDGTMDLHGTTELLAEGPSWARFDGHRAMPMVTSTIAMRAAMDKARATGTAAVGVCNSGHFGAAGYYANMAAHGNMIGISMCNVDPGVAAPGSAVAVLGTNPLSYAVPAGDGTTVFLDIATSVVAAGKVYAAQAAGTGIPEGWLIDKDGLPTTDPRGYPAIGALLPMAGHKGYGIALMIEILTGVLNGGAFGKDVVSWVKDGKPVNQSFSFIVIDIGAFMPVDRFVSRMGELAREIHGAPKARGTERIYLPGEKEWENRARALRDGLALPPDVVANLEGVAKDYSLDPAGLYGS
jgi:ureidoglycolate dehydrogenase (NAD+)